VTQPVAHAAPVEAQPLPVTQPVTHAAPVDAQPTHRFYFADSRLNQLYHLSGVKFASFHLFPDLTRFSLPFSLIFAFIFRI
jgi:hypothetical protein